MAGSGVAKGTSINFSCDPYHRADWPVRNPAITQQIMIRFSRIFSIALQRYKEQLIKFWGDLDHHADFPVRNQGNMEVMSYLSQGCPCSLSALVGLYFLFYIIRHLFVTPCIV